MRLANAKHRSPNNKLRNKNKCAKSKSTSTKRTALVEQNELFPQLSCSLATVKGGIKGGRNKPRTRGWAATGERPQVSGFCYILQIYWVGSTVHPSPPTTTQEYWCRSRYFRACKLFFSRLFKKTKPKHTRVPGHVWSTRGYVDTKKHPQKTD